MKFTPQNIAKTLKDKGLPIARLTKREKVTGVEVSKFGNRIIFQWRDWGWGKQIGIEVGSNMVIEALAEMGYKATSPLNNGLYVIHN